MNEILINELEALKIEVMESPENKNAVILKEEGDKKYELGKYDEALDFYKKSLKDRKTNFVIK